MDDHAWEDDILVRTAEKHGVSVRFLPEQTTVTSVRDTVETTRGALKTVGRYVRPLGRVFRYRLEYTLEAPSQNDTIPFQIASPYMKHVENIETPMRALEAYDEYDGVALCWSCPDSAREIRNRGLCALKLESFVPVASLGPELVRNYRLWRTDLSMKRPW